MMKMLWVTYAPIGKMSQILRGEPTQSGTWIDAAIAALGAEEVSITLMCGYSESKKIVVSNKLSYYTITNCAKVRGKVCDESANICINKAFEDINPDIVIIWGAEYANGLNYIEVAKRHNTPTLVFIQGVVSSIVDHISGDLDHKQYSKKLSLIGKLKSLILIKRQADLIKQVSIEEKIIKEADGIICDSDWCKSEYEPYKKHLKSYQVSLPISEVFLNKRWKYEKCEVNTIFCIAGNDPKKGLHQLVEAARVIKLNYPKFRIIVPGAVTSKEPAWIYQNPYMEYIYKLIKEYDLSENIVFSGMLSSEEMAQHMLSSNAFVMMSCVENHSSTLREAMFLGVPCISASVSSVPEFLMHGENGYLYRYSDYKTLAFYIKKLFSEPETAKKLGTQAYISIRKQFPQEIIGKQFMAAANQCISEFK